MSIWPPQKKSRRTPQNFHPQEIVIRPASKALKLDLMELYKYRHLLWNLITRDVKLQFDSMYLGVAWATARPLLMVIIFALFRSFSGANLQVPIPYMIYVYSGLILWFYFIEATSLTSRSIQKNASLITKVYYPRVINLIVPPVASLYGLMVAAFPLLVMMVVQDVYPGWRIIFLPLVVLFCALLALATGTVFAVLSLNSMDFDKLLGQILYIGLYVSPVIFAPGLIPEDVRLLYFANPMVGILMAFRSCLFNAYPFPGWAFLSAIILTVSGLVLGITLYQRAEVYLADRL